MSTEVVPVRDLRDGDRILYETRYGEEIPCTIELMQLDGVTIRFTAIDSNGRKYILPKTQRVERIARPWWLFWLPV
jgi:hypothetical protein